LKPASFQYHRPRDTDETLSVLKEFEEEAKFLAGGQSLMPLMNFRLAQPAHLIDINFNSGNGVRQERVRHHQSGLSDPPSRFAGLSSGGPTLPAPRRGIGDLLGPLCKFTVFI
jgi:hypothetical protein